MRLFAICFAAALTATACAGASSADAGAGGGSGGGSGTGGGGGGSTGCTVSVSGAVTGTQACTVAMKTAAGQTTFQFQTLAATQHTQSIIGTVVLTGTPSATSYGVSSPTLQSRIDLTVNDTQTWEQLYKDSDPNAAAGTFTLAFTDAGTIDSVSAMYSDMHGSVNATATRAGAADCALSLTF